MSCLYNFKAGQKLLKLPADKESLTWDQTQPELFAKFMAMANEMSKAYTMCCILKLAIGIAVKRKCVLFL